MPEMRQLPDGTWLDEETGVVVAPEVFSHAAGQNDVYTGPPLMPNPRVENAALPLPMARGGPMPAVRSPTLPSATAGMGQYPGPHLAVSPFALDGIGAFNEKAKKVLIVVGLVGIVGGTVWLKNRINGKKKKKA